MNKVWLLMLISGVSTLLFVNPSAVLEAAVQGSMDSVNLSMRLVALYAFWLGFFALLEKTGVSRVLAKILRPVVRFLFPGENEETRKFVTLNMSANLLGLGNAATPMAIRGINAMDDGSGVATVNMVMLMVISATSLQLLPTTVIGLRTTHGSASPADFMVGSLVATLVSTAIGITLVKFYNFIRKKIKRRKEKLQAKEKLCTPLNKDRG